MGRQFLPSNPGQRDGVRRGGNGIDHLEIVSTSPKKIALRFLFPLPGHPGGLRLAQPIVFNVLRDILIQDARGQPLLRGFISVAGNQVEMDLSAADDRSQYTLRIVPSFNSPPGVPPYFDPHLREVEFSFRADTPGGEPPPVTDADCRPPAEAAPVPSPTEPALDYLAKDYASFRQLMLDRLSVTLPDWKERSPADVGITLVELLAYAADHLSYYQDAVATEAYLGTARKRVSVRRHARLLDYFLHEGCNARAWVHVEVDREARLPQGTILLTRTGADAGPVSQDRLADAVREGAQAFETLHDLYAYPEHNLIRFDVGQRVPAALEAGATSTRLLYPSAHLGATEVDVKLRQGDVLVFEEAPGQVFADPARRHAVRVATIKVLVPPDPVRVEITWSEEDALPFSLPLTAYVARGNIVLADHGHRVPFEPLAQVPDQGQYFPLRSTPITHRVEYRDADARKQPARAALVQDPHAALPVITLREREVAWTPKPDLLGSDRFAEHFVVEIDDDRQAHLRFGDGVRGRSPRQGEVMSADYRVGNGRAGNVGPDTITGIVLKPNVPTGVRVRNPLPATGGLDPEPIEEARRCAPKHFRLPRREVTAED